MSTRLRLLRWMTFLALSLAMGSMPWSAARAEQEESIPDAIAPKAERTRFQRRSLSGPRFGVTYLAGHGELVRTVKEEDMDRVVSQFGWLFERRVVPEGGGPQFVVELMPMVAGVEYGKIIPHATLAMGVRWPAGWEFAIGPNLMGLRRDEAPDLVTSLEVSLGKSFEYAGVSLPLNVAYTTNPDGDRLSLLVGYAIARP